MAEAANNPVPVEPSLEYLSLRQREVAQLAGEGRSYTEIGKELDIQYSTVRSHLNSIYKKLGMRNRFDLALLVGQSEYIELPTEVFAGLSPSQWQVFISTANGYTFKETAHRLQLNNSTVRTHLKNINNTLGLKNSIELVRVADRWRDQAERAAKAVQPEAVEVLNNLKQASTQEKVRLDKDNARTIKDDPNLLEFLRSRGYITNAMARIGRLGLSAVTASLLLRRPQTRELLLDCKVTPVVREVISQEVSLVLKKPKQQGDSAS